jgi:hypothetical protein
MTRGSGPWLALLAIAGVTIAGGLVQLVHPAFVLELVGAVVSPTSQYAFAVIGMFIAMFGGLLLNAMHAEQPQPVAVLWVAVEKVAGCLAALFGVFKGYFASGALGIVFFDFFAALLIIWYWRTVRWPTTTATTS